MEILCKGNGVHLITTIYCHCSFRFPPQHTLRARPLAVPSGALRAASLRSIASPAHRGVCSRIPHPRQISRDSHGQISTHVYILHIIPFLGCPPHSPPTTAAIPHPSSDRSTSCDLAAQGSSRCSSGNLIATRQANLAARPMASGDMRGQQGHT